MKLRLKNTDCLKVKLIISDMENGECSYISHVMIPYDVYCSWERVRLSHWVKNPFPDQKLTLAAIGMTPEDF